MESRGEDDAGLELPEVTTERSSLIIKERNDTCKPVADSF